MTIKMIDGSVAWDEVYGQREENTLMGEPR